MNANLDLLLKSLEAWNRQDLITYRKLYTEDAVIHGLAPVPLDVPTALAGYEAFFAGFPDLHLKVLDTICENGNIAVHFQLTGTQHGPFQGIPATGRAIDVNGITTLHYRDGHVYARWNQLDQMKMLQQLGVIPA